MFESFVAKIAGKWIAGKVNLQEGQMDQTKPWYKSKGIWTGIVTGLIAAYNAISPQFGLHVIPDWIFALLGAAGVYSRATADTKITS